MPVGYADVRPVDGSGNHMIAPEQAGSAGGDGFLLERAVLQSSPGVPLLDGSGNVQYVALDQADFVRPFAQQGRYLGRAKVLQVV